MFEQTLTRSRDARTHRQSAMPRWGAAVVIAITLMISACTRPADPSARRDADPNSPAGKVGQAAHKAADKLEEVGKKAGKEIKKTARQAKAGWDKADRDKKD